MMKKSMGVLFGTLLPFSALGAVYHVDPVDGDDSHTAAEAQSVDTPWKSLTHALSEAVDGDSIQLAAGAYSESSGEEFPIALVDGVSVIGESMDETVFLAPEMGSAVLVNAGPLGPNTFLSNLTLSVDTEQPEWFVNGLELDGELGSVELSVERVRFDSPIASGIHVEAVGADAVFAPVVYESEFTSFVGVYAAVGAVDGVQFAGFYAGNSFACQEFAVMYYTNEATETIFSPQFYENTMEGGFGGILLGATGGTGSLDFQPMVWGNQILGVANGFSLQLSANGSGHDEVVFSPLVVSNWVETEEDLDGYADPINVVYEGGPAAAVVADVQVRNNSVSSPEHEGSGISVWLLATGTSEVEWNVLVDHNRTEGFSTGLDVAIPSLAGATGFVDAQILGNETFASGFGMRLNVSPDAAIDWSGMVAGNSLSGEYIGLWAWLDKQELLTANETRILDNVVYGYQQGIYLMSAGVDHTSVEVSGNAASADEGSAFLQDGLATPVMFVQEAWPADFGGGALDALGLNQFSTGGAYVFRSNSDHDVAAQQNYWGTTQDVDALIFDDDEGDGYFAGVDAGDPLSEAPAAEPTLELEITLVSDPGEDGVSDGDTVEFVATVGNDGNIGCAVPWLQIGLLGGGLVDLSLTQGEWFEYSGDGFPVEFGAGLQRLAAGQPVEARWSVLVEDCSVLQSDAQFTCEGYTLSANAGFECGEGATVDTDEPIDTDDTDGTVDSELPDTEDEHEHEHGGCGCQGAAPPVGEMLVLASLLWVRRRTGS